jgi:CRP-like cAMP-binding protein
MSDDNQIPVPGSIGQGEGDSIALGRRIKEAALSGDFKQAERLREQLIEKDPMNLTLIVSTGEVIERQKTRRLDQDHLAVWAHLYENFSEEETNRLFYSLEPAVIAPSKLLLAQGKVNNRLIFIDSGKVALFYRKENNNKVVLQLSRGEVIGEDSFFEISLCPLSAATQTEVKLYSLKRAEAEKWHDALPGLYEKLGDFCRRHGKGRQGLSQKKQDQRSSPRYEASGVVTATLLDQQGTPTADYFKGGLSDISRTGLSFEFKCSSYDSARALLARQVKISTLFSGSEVPAWVTRATIVSVGFHLHNDYSVHLKFDEKIDKQRFQTFPCGSAVGDAASQHGEEQQD